MATLNIYTKDDVHVLLNKGEELKYNVSKLAAILSDLQNKNQIGGELDLSTGKYALYRHQDLISLYLKDDEITYSKIY